MALARGRIILSDGAYSAVRVIGVAITLCPALSRESMVRSFMATFSRPISFFLYYAPLVICTLTSVNYNGCLSIKKRKPL